MNARMVVVGLMLFVTGVVALAADSASQPATRPAAVHFDGHDGYFVSNQFEPEKPESFVVLKDQKSFDDVFGVGRVMNDRSHRLPPDAFDTKMVVAAIKRGKAVWQFQVKEVVAEGKTLTVRYTATPQKNDSAEFACPLIVSVPQGPYTEVVFEEGGKVAGRVLTRGHVLFHCDFEGAEALKPWSGGGQLTTGHGGGQAMVITCATAGSTLVRVNLPVEALRGYTLYGYAHVKAENVSHRPQSWNGIKVMAVVESPAGKGWAQARVPEGTFDWQEVTLAGRIPADATGLTLCLGLEAVSGKAWFDDVRIVVGKVPVSPVPTNGDGPMFRGVDLPRLRGAMIHPGIDEAGLRTLGRDWGANVIRWQLVRTGPAAKLATVEEYDAWLEGQLKRLDAMLPLCRKYGVYVVLDLHSPWGGQPTAGGYAGSDGGLFTRKACQEHFVTGWKQMATRYKAAKEIWGYDLVNEPVEGVVAPDCDDWHGLATRAAKAIRAVDADRAIIVEPNEGGGPEALADFPPIDAANVVYSVHMYVPGAFTHQGVFDPKTPAYRYPGKIAGQDWDKAALDKVLAPVVAYQKKYHVAIYVGEFSAIRWAPDQSALRYLTDVIDLFEAHGWDWSYHAFREWPGWSVEYPEDRVATQPARNPTERQKLLMRWYAKNQKPAW